ncbi:MAG TPA: type II toxin-antitoxin system RelE/ParE family toxin [Candidatus Bathyarchaeia archaeon]|nr:type II toxin-antitoxin system RelE/ParE family toxin [Candidatus Bathyarchaeia archaeon]
MNWKIGFSRDAEKFLKQENLRSETVAEIINFLKKMKGESVSVDVKKLKGDWQGFYRIRKGKLRIIFELNFQEHSIYVARIDQRGKVYK